MYESIIFFYYNKLIKIELGVFTIDILKRRFNSANRGMDDNVKQIKCKEVKREKG
jgi:hypothetical protein